MNQSRKRGIAPGPPAKLVPTNVVDGTGTWYFAFSEQKKNGEQSGSTFYYQLTLTIKDGKIVGKPKPVEISGETYQQRTGRTANHPKNLNVKRKKGQEGVVTNSGAGG